MRTQPFVLIVFALFTSESAGQFLSRQADVQGHSGTSSLQAYTPPLDSAALDSFITKTMKDYYIAGLSACVVRDGQMKWHRNYGYANLRDSTLVSDSTLWLLSSVSKVFVTTAVMRLREQGLFTLDDDINQFLPSRLQVRHPSYPNSPLTFRMLLTHSSGIRDDLEVLYAMIVQGDSPISLDSLLVNYLVRSGIWYDAGKNFYNEVPGTQCHSSDVGFALLGYLVERISGKTLEQYCQENIFHPLDMNNSSWWLTNLDTSLIAMPYKWSGTAYLPYGYYGAPFYPAQQLRTSTVQLSNFLIAIMNGGTYHQKRILDSLTIKDMMVRRFYEYDAYWGSNVYYGLGILQTDLYSSSWVWGYGGKAGGVITTMRFHPDGKWGFIGLCNTGYMDQSWDGALLCARQVCALAESFPSAIEHREETVVKEFYLERNYPNPFNPSTTIKYELPMASVVRLSVYDVLGREVSVLVNDRRDAGVHEVKFDGSNASSGVYFYRLHAGDFVSTKKFILLK